MSEATAQFNDLDVKAPGLVGRTIINTLSTLDLLRKRAAVILGTLIIATIAIASFIAVGGNTSTFAKPKKYDGLWSGWAAKNDDGYFEVKNLGIFGGTHVYDHTNHHGTWHQDGDNVMRRTYNTRP